MKSNKYLVVIVPILILSVFLSINLTEMPTIEDPEVKIDNSFSKELKTSTMNGGGYIMNTDSSYSWIEINGTIGTHLGYISNGTLSYESISFSGQTWNFTFYGTEYDTIHVSSNGWMSFTNSFPSSSSGSIPSTSSNNDDCIALLWEDLDFDIGPGRGDVSYYFEGATSVKYLVIEYCEVFYDDWPDPIKRLGSFEVILYENGNITFQYQNLGSVSNIDFFNPTIGLDHGDGVNYNCYTDINEKTVPILSKAISFTFNELSNYNLSVEVNDEYLWIVSELNNTAMEIVLGADWESFFGLAQDIYQFDKMKINITSIVDNSTHWEANYTIYDWTNYKNSFSTIASVQNSLLYHHDPTNYTQPYNLTNIFPLFLPNFSLGYLLFTPLDNFYISTDVYSDVSVQLQFILTINAYLMIIGEAIYSIEGFLEDMRIEWVYDDGDVDYTYNIFKINHFHEGPKPSYIGVAESENYEYGNSYCLENNKKFFLPYPCLNPKLNPFSERFKYTIDYISGNNPFLERTIVILNMSQKKDGSWVYVGQTINLVHGNLSITNERDVYENCFLVANNVDWQLYTQKMVDKMILVLSNALSDGFEVNIIFPLDITFKQTYISKGMLNIASAKYVDNEYLTMRLNDFDYEVCPSEEEKDDEPPADNFLLILIIVIIISSVAALIGIIGYRNMKSKLWQKEREILALKLKRKKISEGDIELSKDQHICLVHKSTITGHCYICPTCKAFYCSKCFEAVIKIDNCCWSCEKALDPSKPYVRPREIAVEQESKKDPHKK